VCEDGLIHNQIYNSTTHTGKMERVKVMCINFGRYGIKETGLECVDSNPLILGLDIPLQYVLHGCC
jgi:hypothetical protein